MVSKAIATQRDNVPVRTVSKPSTSCHNLSGGHVKKIDLSSFDFQPFINAVEEELAEKLQSFTRESEDYDLTAQHVANTAKRLVITHFPPDLIETLFAFPYTHVGPSAILLQGLPTIDPVPPSPLHAEGVVAPCNTLVSAILLGIGQTIGTVLTAGAIFLSNSYNGLVSNLVPMRENDSDTRGTDLLMHRDYPASLKGIEWEPEALLLFGMRGDDTHEAFTKVINVDAVLSQAAPEDIELLQRAEVQAEMFDIYTGEVIAKTDPFVPIVGDYATFFSYRLGGLPIENHGDRWVSETPGAAEAYERVSNFAWEHADSVDLQHGELLLINNVRALHGRTAYVPKSNNHPGKRWIAKVQVSFEGWKVPGTFPKKKYGIGNWPKLP